MKQLKEYILEKFKINSKTIKSKDIIKFNDFSKFIFDLLMNTYKIKENQIDLGAGYTTYSIVLTSGSLKKHNIQDIIDDIILHLPKDCKCEYEYDSLKRKYKIYVKYV